MVAFQHYLEETVNPQLLNRSVCCEVGYRVPYSTRYRGQRRYHVRVNLPWQQRLEQQPQQPGAWMSPPPFSSGSSGTADAQPFLHVLGDSAA